MLDVNSGGLTLMKNMGKLLYVLKHILSKINRWTQTYWMEPSNIIYICQICNDHSISHLVDRVPGHCHLLTALVEFHMNLVIAILSIDKLIRKAWISVEHQKYEHLQDCGRKKWSICSNPHFASIFLACRWRAWEWCILTMNLQWEDRCCTMDNGWQRCD